MGTILGEPVASGAVSEGGSGLSMRSPEPIGGSAGDAPGSLLDIVETLAWETKYTAAAAMTSRATATSGIALFVVGELPAADSSPFSSVAPALNPQRHVRIRFGTWRSHDGHTHD
jgi:hypothetical protein